MHSVYSDILGTLSVALAQSVVGTGDMDIFHSVGKSDYGAPVTYHGLQGFALKNFCLIFGNVIYLHLIQCCNNGTTRQGNSFLWC